MSMQYCEFRAMSTEILLGAEGPQKSMEAAFRQVRMLVEQEERRFTRFSPDSELSFLNRSAGKWTEVSPEMFEVLALSREMHTKTGGLFEPGILDALESAGYDRTIEDLRRFGPASLVQVVAPLRTAGIDALELDESSDRVRLPAGLRIDLGGIAKGWIAVEAAKLLAEWFPNCLVDAGGDMLLTGLPEGETAWQVALEDPREPEEMLAVLDVPPGAVATSSVMKRRWNQGGVENHHLIDPRIGRPADAAWISLTAIASSLVDAEVFAKALLIAGPGEASRLAEANGIEFVAVDRDGKLWGTEKTREYIHE